MSNIIGITGGKSDTPAAPERKLPNTRIYHFTRKDGETLSAEGYLIFMGGFIAVANGEESDIDLLVPFDSLMSIEAEPDTDVEVA